MPLKIQKDVIQSKTEELFEPLDQKQFQKEKRNKEYGTEQNILDSQGSQKNLKPKTHQKNKILYEHARAYFQNFSETFKQKEAYFQSISIQNTDMCFQPFLSHLYSDLNDLVCQKPKDIKLEQTIDSKTQKFLSKLQKQCRVNIQLHLLRSKRFQKMNTFTKELLIRQIYPTKHYEIVRIQIHYLWYKTTLQILNATQRSTLHTCANVSDSGTFGSIYFIKYSNQEIAVKCIPVSKQKFLSSVQYTKTQNLSKHFVQIIRQYFFLLMFSELKVGPTVKNIGGFDMVFYEDCIEFGTEICQSFDMISSANELKKSLFVMHMFQVVHRDIKPGNILYSKTYKKPVFIDFGCTEVIKETLGQKTLTKFAGTMGFCTDEVVNLLSKKRGEANLYGNDLHGLSVSIEQLGKQVKISKQIQISKINNYCLCLTQMKHFLYHEDYENFHELWRKVRRQYPSQFDQIQSKLTYFFFELKPTEYLKYFFFSQVDENIQDSLQLSNLKNILKSQANDFYFYNFINPEKQKILKIYQIIYKVLQTENSQLEKIQISIVLILINAQIIRSLIFELQQNLRQLILLKKSLRTQLFQKFKQLCIVTAYYSSLASEQYKASIQDKVSVCESTLNIIQIYQPQLNIEDLLIFQTPFTNLNPISNFYHFFMVKIWDKIPQNFKSKSLITTMMNLYLLGYPLTKRSSEILLSNIFLGAQKSAQYANLNKEERFLKIFYFMQTRLIRIFFKYVLFNKNKIKTQFRDDLVIQSYLKTLNNLFLPEQNHDQDFLLLANNQLNQYFGQNFLFSNQSDIQKLIKLLNSHKINQFQTSLNYKLIKKWKSLLWILLRIYSLGSSLLKLNKIDENIQQNLSFLDEYKKTILPLVIKISQSPTASIGSKYYMFNRFYEIISYDPISQHYYVQKQLQIAIQRKDTYKIIRIASLLESQLQFGLQLTNILVFRQILDVLYKFAVFNGQIQPSLLGKQYLNFLSIVFKAFAALRQVGLILNRRNFSFPYLRPKIFNQLDPYSLQSGMQVDKNIRNCLFNFFQIANFFKSVQQMAISNEIGTHFQAHELSYFKQFIQHYRQDHKAFLPAQQWFQFIQQRSDVKKTFRQDKLLSIRLIQFYISQRKMMGQVIPTQTVVEELFGKLEAKNFRNQSDGIKQPTLYIAFDYFQAHVIKSKYNIQWCEQLFQLYKITKKKKKFTDFFFSNQLIRMIFNSMVYLNKNSQEFGEFYIYIAQLLKIYSSETIINMIKTDLLRIFWCKCQGCFPRYPEGWNPTEMSKFLFQNIKFQRASENPYLALIYTYALNSKHIPKPLIRRGVCFIIKALPYLANHIRQMIKPKIFLYIYKGFEESEIFDMKPGQNKYQTTKKEGNVETIIQNFYTTKSQMNSRRNRKFINFFQQLKKNQSYTMQSLDNLVEQRFFLQFFVKGYYFPTFVKKLFTKKLRRFYEVKQNYKQIQQQKKFKHNFKHIIRVNSYNN